MYEGMKNCYVQYIFFFFFFFELEVYTPLLVQQESAKLLWQNLCVISKGLQRSHDCNT